MPFIDKKVEQIKELKRYSGCDYLFCHSDLNGAKMHLTSVANKNLDKIDVDEFSGYNDVRTGHIHIRQKIGNITFVGSVFEMDRNDMDNTKGIFILDTNTVEETFVENKISPKFKKVYVRVEEDISSLDKISTRDYIDLYISNSLLINNRKLRRKLEIILETGNFASVEYLDDINKTDSTDDDDIKESIVNEALDNNQIHDVKLEYKEVIRDYISSLKYGSDKTKSGILNEYDEIVKIYDDGYDKKKRK